MFCMAYIVMAFIVIAFIVMAYTLMASRVMPYVDMAYIVMAFVVMALTRVVQMANVIGSFNLRWPGGPVQKVLEIFSLMDFDARPFFALPFFPFSKERKRIEERPRFVAGGHHRARLHLVRWRHR